MKRPFVSLAVVTVAQISTVGAANALCDTVDLNDDHNVAIVGEILQWSSGIGAYIPVGSGTLGVCWQDGTSGTWVLETTSCSAYSTWDRLRINARGGNDTVIAHPAGASTFYCESASYVIAPADWVNVFNVGLDTYLGEGSDTFHGSPRSDVCRSNDFAMTDDGEGDTLCGYGDSDGLYGDDDSVTGWANNECLNGGAGSSDVCNGGAVNTSPDHDDAWYCESVSNTYPTPYTAACRDACTSPDLSPSNRRCPSNCN